MAKGTGDSLNFRSVPSSFGKELVPVQFLQKGTSSRNLRSFGPFLTMFGHLKKHERTHKEQKPFACSKCDMAFNYDHILKEHERTHKGEKLFACTKCAKKFQESGNLKKHARTHKGQKPFVCSKFDKAFKYINHLRNHERTYIEEKQFALNRQIASLSLNVLSHLEHANSFP